MAYGWQGDEVRLVPLDRDRHLDNAIQWLNDPELTRWLETGDWPVTRLAEEDFFDRMCAPGNTSDVAFAIETLDGDHLGFSGVHRIDLRHGVAVSGSFIGRAERRGRGLGTDAARVRARWAFEVLGLRLLVAEVMAGNDASLAMLAKLGYREVGRIPERYWKRGAYRDQILMVLRRGEAG